MERRKLKIALRDYQDDADKGIKRIFRRDYHNRFAGVVLPTGGGKSFVAIKQLMTFGKDDNAEIEIDENGMVNDANMLYVAPSHEILNQVKLHFVKNVLLSIDGMDKMTIAEIDDFLSKNLAGVKFPGINSNLKRGEKPLSDSASEKEKINAILRKLSVKDIDELVKKAFPNLKFCCYAGVKSGEGITNEDIEKAQLIITDEAHRLGASTWGRHFFNNLAKNKTAKILGITATPDRTDSKAKNMFAEIAREIYPDESVTPDEYMAQEIYVMDAMRDGIVLAPRVHQTDATLALSEQYNQILDSYKKLDPDDPKRAMYEEALDDMEEIIGFPARKMKPKEIEDKIKEERKKLIAESIANKNGKYIAFIPANTQKDLEKPDSDKFLRDWKKQIEESFKGVLDENGKPVKVTFYFLTSNKAIKLDSKGNPVIPKEGDKGPFTTIDSSEVIKDFEDSSNETGGIKIIITNDMLNEGVHVDGIDGSIMFRPAGSSTIYLQQAGRCISSLDPSKPLSMQPKTQIIDACGNSFAQTSKGTGRKSSVDYDLKRVEQIVKWIDENHRFPDINSIAASGTPEDQAKAEREARLAISIKRIQKRYGSFFENGTLPIEDEDKVASLLKAAEAVSLFIHKIPERTVEPSEAELAGEEFLHYTESQERFMSIYDRIRSKEIRMTAPERVNKLMGIVRILKMYKKDIKFPQGIYVKGPTGGKDNKNGEVMSKDTESLSLQDLLRANFDEETIKKILVDIKNYDLMQTSRYSEIYHDGENYDIGMEMAFVRGKIYTSMLDQMKDSRYSLFDKYEFKDFLTYGIIQDGKADIQKMFDMDGDYEYAVSKARARKNGGGRTIKNADYYVDYNGRVQKGFHTKHIRFGMIDRFEECSLTTGEKYIGGFDRDGFDKDGYDVEGYNRLGFDRRGVHKITHSKYDERGFYFDEKKQKWLNSKTGSEYDLLGYNIYGFNEGGFERPIGPKAEGKSWKYIKPLWHFKLPIKNDSEQSDEAPKYSAHGYIYSDANPSGVKPRDANGFTGKTSHIDANNPLYKKSSGDGFYFNSDGANRPLGTGDNYRRYEERDFYVNGVDIDGYDKYGFKTVVQDGKKVHIHRTTSTEHDRSGRVLTFEQQKGKRGNYAVRTVKLDPDIREAQRFIVEVLGGNVSPEVFVRKYSDISGKPVNYVRNMYKNALKSAFSLYRYECPEAFNAIGNFKGLEYYYLNDISSTEKRKRLDEFFEFCPEAKEILQLQYEANERALRKLQRTEHRRGLTRQEQDKKKARIEKQSMYDKLDIDDRE